MKASELREMTELELQKNLEESKEDLFNLRFKKAKNTLENVHAIRHARRNIARINTIIAQKKVKAGS